MIVIARHVFRIQLDHHLAISQDDQSMKVSVFVAKRFDRFGKSPGPHSDVLGWRRGDLI
jgi:hypothetical protein